MFVVYTRDSFVCAQLCETMRNYSKLCETIRNYAKLCKTIRNYAKLCKTMRNYAKLCKTMQTKQFSQICRKLDTQFRTNVSIRTRLRIESSLPEFARCARCACGARGNGSQSAVQTPPSHTRRGLGLREFHKLPQNSNFN